MKNIVLIIGTIAVTLIIAAAQQYLSTRRKWQLGGIVPVLSIGIMTVLFYVKQVPLSRKMILLCTIILVIELFIWFDGRKEYKKQELRKMKAKDIS